MRDASDARITRWCPLAFAVVLAFAWSNFLFTAKWATLPGALNGWKRPYYAAALIVSTLLFLLSRRRVGQPAAIGRIASWSLVVVGASVLVTGLLSRLPLASWSSIPFLDDWTGLYHEAVSGVRLLREGAVVGWNWSFLGGYPTSTAISQNFGLMAFLPMQLFGEAVGYHVLHAVFFLSLPLFVWWDLRQEDKRLGLVAAGFACFFVTGYYGPLGTSGDTNSLAGVFAATVAMFGSRAARLGRRWGGPVLVAGLVCAIYSHTAFFIYALMLLGFECLYFRDLRAAIRLAGAAAVAGLVSLPMYWESLRYPSYLIVNNTTYDPRGPVQWGSVARSIYYSVELLVQPHRWFNDYRSLVNVWWPAMLALALIERRSRAGFFAWLAVVALGLLRLDTSEFGVIFGRLVHLLPVIAAPALAGVVLRLAGTRALALAFAVLIALYVQSDFSPIRHVSGLRDFDAALTERIASLDGNLVVLEMSPHKDMDADPVGKSPKPPFPAHFEALLPAVAGQRFYLGPWDGWGWNIYRDQIVAAGTFRGHAIAQTPVPVFEAEMRRWGIKHLLVWTDATRNYLSGSGLFIEWWRHERWSHFELPGVDGRTVVTPAGSGQLVNARALSADIVLDGVAANDPIVVRTNFYPAWQARSDAGPVALYDTGGQIGFRAPSAGSYTVHLEYPKRTGLSLFAIAVLIAGMIVLSTQPRRQ
jgi:hypothetical protein